jgi:hypothetical protein
MFDNVNPPVNPSSAVFDFTEFVRKIYLENSGAHEEKFFLPGRYGGFRGKVNAVPG